MEEQKEFKKRQAELLKSINDNYHQQILKAISTEESEEIKKT